MTVKIIKKDELIGISVVNKITLELDSEEAGVYKGTDKSINLEVSEDSSILSAKQFLVTSNKLKVRDGDVVQMSYRKQNMALIPIFIFLILAVPFILNIESVVYNLLLVLPFVAVLFCIGIRKLVLEVVDHKNVLTDTEHDTMN